MRFLLFEETEGFADKNKILIYSIGIDIIDLDGVIGIEVGILLVNIGKNLDGNEFRKKIFMFILYKRSYF